MLRRVLVGDNERVLLIRNKRFADILAPGEYWLFVLRRDIQLERHNIKSLVFASDWADFIVTERPELGARYFTVIETSPTHVAAVYADGKLLHASRAHGCWARPRGVTYHPHRPWPHEWAKSQ